jgi:transcriptional regulator with XRE-family HTH domain
VNFAASVYSMSPTRFRLAAILNRAGVTQTELARRTGLSFATINRLCTNATAQVSLETLDKIAIELDVPVGDLFETDRRPKRGKGK